MCLRAVVHEGAWFVLLFLWGVTALSLCHDVATAKEITDQLSGIELVNFNSGEVLRCCVAVVVPVRELRAVAVGLRLSRADDLPCP